MARKDVHSIVSGAGWIGSFSGFLVEALEELGVSMEDIHKLGKPTKEGRLLVQECAERIAEAVNGARYSFVVTVDYSQSLKDMIEAGSYDWTNSDITDKNFPIQGKGKAEVRLELVHFNRVVNTDEALKELDKRGLRPARIEELLAFGAVYPEIQHKFPIIGLGTVWTNRDGSRYVPGLDEGGSERYLDLDWTDNDWNDRCRFLAVRK